MHNRLKIKVVNLKKATDLYGSSLQVKLKKK